MRRRAATALIGLAALASGAGFAWWRRQQGTERVADAVVEDLFARRFPDPGGTVADLRAFRGKILVVNFWATWCAPCIEEMPELSELQVDTIDQGVQFLGLGIDEAEKIQKFSNKVKVLYPLLVLGVSGMDLARAFGNPDGQLPFTVVIDRAGRIVDRKIGRIDKTRMRRVIQRTVDS